MRAVHPAAAELPPRRHGGPADDAGRLHHPDRRAESPWGMAKFVLFYDTARVPEPPRFARRAARLGRGPSRPLHLPGPARLHRLDLPQARALCRACPIPARLQQPVERGRSSTRSPPASGRGSTGSDHICGAAAQAYPATGQALHQLLDDGEVDFSMAFNPAEASSLILDGRLPETRAQLRASRTARSPTRTSSPSRSTPRTGMVPSSWPSFSCRRRRRRASRTSRVWGDPDRARPRRLDTGRSGQVQELPSGPATLPPDRLGPALAEPHPSWMVLLERRWAERYGG